MLRVVINSYVGERKELKKNKWKVWGSGLRSSTVSMWDVSLPNCTLQNSNSLQNPNRKQQNNKVGKQSVFGDG